MKKTMFFKHLHLPVSSKSFSTSSCREKIIFFSIKKTFFSSKKYKNFILQKKNTKIKINFLKVKIATQTWATFSNLSKRTSEKSIEGCDYKTFLPTLVSTIES
jgi:hypothetical protein